MGDEGEEERLRAGCEISRDAAFALLQESLKYAIAFSLSSLGELVLTRYVFQVNDAANVRLRASIRSLPQ